MIRWIDITDDISKKYYNAFTQQVTMPEYVKSAEVLTHEDSQNISSEAFADSVNKKFALDSKANCWCSALYFYGNQCSNSPVGKQAEDKLLKAARVWGVTEDVANIKKSFEQQLLPATYALSFEYQGKTVERCPDHTKEAATESSEWLYENRLKFPIAVQKAAAVRLLSKANVLNLAPAASTYLDRLANSDSYANINCKVAAAITDRLHSVPTSKWSDLEDELLKIASNLNNDPFAVCNAGDVLATAIETFDVKHKLNVKWGSSIQHPVEICFRANMTKAAAMADSMVHLTTGTPVDLSKISDYQLEKGLKIAGDDFLSYCQTDGFNVDRSKAAEILPTLPKPEAHRFEAAIKSAGYIPETHDKLAERLFAKDSGMYETPSNANSASTSTAEKVLKNVTGPSTPAAKPIPPAPKPAPTAVATPVVEPEIKIAGAGQINSQLLSYAYKLSGYANSTGASPAMQPPVQPDSSLPEEGEDDAKFDARMQEKKDYAKQLSAHAKEISNQAKLENLDAQAAIAASKARQARQARIVNPHMPAQGPQQ